MVFLVVRSYNQMSKRFEKRKADPADPEAPPVDVQLLTEIRDLLKHRAG